MNQEAFNNYLPQGWYSSYPQPTMISTQGFAGYQTAPQVLLVYPGSQMACYPVCQQQGGYQQVTFNGAASSMASVQPANSYQSQYIAQATQVAPHVQPQPQQLNVNQFSKKLCITNPNTNAQIDYNSEINEKAVMEAVAEAEKRSIHQTFKQNVKELLKSKQGNEIANVIATPVKAKSKPEGSTPPPEHQPSEVCANCKIGMRCQPVEPAFVRSDVVEPAVKAFEVISPLGEVKEKIAAARNNSKFIYDKDMLMFIGNAVVTTPKNCPISVEKGLSEAIENTKPAPKKYTNKYQFRRGGTGYRPPISKGEVARSSASRTFEDFNRSDTPVITRSQEPARKEPTAQENSGDSSAPKGEEVVLRKAANAWKPKRRNVDGEESAEAKLEAKKKEIRSILNKITPTSFEELTMKFCELEIYNDTALLPLAVDIIFEKAIDEPKYCSLYSSLCLKKHLYEEKNAGKETFRYAVIHKCQHYFEKSSEKPTASSSSQTNIVDVAPEKPKEDDKEKEKEVAKQDDGDIELQKNLKKRHFLGAIRFISHLYRSSQINVVIISYCVVSLILLYQSEGDEIYIEYVVQLYETIGRTYDIEHAKYASSLSSVAPGSAWSAVPKSDTGKEKDKKEESYENIDKVYSYLIGNMNNNLFSTRISYMIMNMDEMRKNNWAERRADQAPKTMEQLKLEIANEEIQNKQAREEYTNRRQQQQFHKPMTRTPAGRAFQNDNERKMGRAFHNESERKRINAAQASNSVPSNSSETVEKNKLAKAFEDSNRLGPKGGSFTSFTWRQSKLN